MIGTAQLYLSFKIWLVFSIALHFLVASFATRSAQEMPKFTVRPDEESVEAHFIAASLFTPATLALKQTTDAAVDILNNNQSDTVQEVPTNDNLPETQPNLAPTSLASQLTHQGTPATPQPRAPQTTDNIVNSVDSQCPLRHLLAKITQAQEAIESKLPVASPAHGASSYHPPCPICNPEPRYPSQARRLGHEGIVKIQVAIDIEGTPVSAQIIETSGYPELDQRAQETVAKKWRFTPAKQGDTATEATLKIQIKFQMKSHRKSIRQTA